MRILVFKPFEEPYVEEIDGSLESMQEVVGGYIELLYPHNDESVIVCNEEGKIKDLPWNRPIVDENGYIIDVMSGTFFICNAPADSEDLTSITDEQIDYYTNKYGYTFTIDPRVVC